MKLRRPEPLATWLRVLVCAFGLLILVGGFTAPSLEMTVPALVVGLGWALFGWFGGLPLLSVEAGSSPGSEADSLEILKSRRIMALCFPLLWPLVAVVVLPRVPPPWLPAIFVATALPFGLFPLLLATSACPRCGKHFFGSKLYVFPLRDRCAHCGLSIKADGRGAA